MEQLIQKLPAKHQKLAAQFTKYLGVAFVGLIVDFGTLVFMREVVDMHYLWAAVCGFVAGLVVNYALSSRYVFSNPKIKSHAVNFGLFALIGLIGLGILSGLMWVFTGLIGINYIISKCIATAFVYAWNFFARRVLYHGDEPTA